ncbi:MAG TPA: HAMP domain-containing sensor histidine kinase [Gaiellaceae bacterium]|nr:HAMP domain-containing sensor histidine kinase [Gaiellaceae bacterium]
MTRRRISVRVFLLAAVLALIVLPVASGTAAWFIERERHNADLQQRVHAAIAELRAQREGIALKDKDSLFRLDRRIASLHLVAQYGLIDKLAPDKTTIDSQVVADHPKGGPDRNKPKSPPPNWHAHDFVIPMGAARPSAAIAGTLYYPPASLTARAFVALVAGVFVLLAGLGVTVWVAGRWIVKPLSRLSLEVDKIAGGDLAVTPPRSPLSEVANVAAAIDGMANALGESGAQQAAADEARRFLVTAVAHDLRTPLFTLRGHVEAIAKGIGDPAEHLAKTEERAASIERLIASLFAYARHDYAPQEPQLGDVVLGDLISRVAAAFHRDVFVLEGDERLTVVADEERLERVLANVFDNALRHGPPDSAVEVSWYERGSTVEVTVADRGPGIDADLLPQIFLPMVRGDRSRSSETGGAGLGLTIAKRLIESQGGSIAAENRPGGGAEVTLMLRRATATLAAAPHDPVERYV